MEIKFLTAREIWEGYDPRSLPLENSTAQSSRNDNLVRKTQIFVVDDGPDGRSRGAMQIYMDSRWADRRNAILLIPQIKGADISDIVLALIGEGYVVGVPDYTGSFIPDGTAYSPELSYAAYPQCNDRLLTIDGDATGTPWYVWCKFLRRAICVLEEESVVENGRVGVIGLGAGAQLAWMVAGLDSRVKAVVPISGGGYLWAMDRPRFSFGNVPETEQDNAFSTGVGAETYARFITCPIFYLTSRMSANNDVDRAGDIIGLVKSKNKQLLIMNSVDERISQPAFEAMLTWLRTDFELGGDTSPEPTANYENRDGRLYIRFYTEKTALSADVYVSYGEPCSAARNWRRYPAPQQTGEHEYILAVPVYDEKELIAAYANFTYEGGVIASTPVHGIIPEKIGVKASEQTGVFSKIIFDNTRDTSQFLPITDGMIQKSDIISMQKGPFDIMGVTASDGALAICRDSHEMSALDRMSVLHFDVYSPVGRELVVNMYTYPEMKRYSAYAKLSGGEFWQKILLSKTDFKSEEGKTLNKFTDTKVMSINNVKGILLNNFVWI